MDEKKKDGGEEVQTGEEVVLQHPLHHLFWFRLM